MKFLTILIIFFLSGCAGQKPAALEQSTPLLRITEINPNKWTALTRQNLEHLLQVYDLAPAIFTHDIQIESRVIPHSHPILTLNTRYAEHPNKLLSVFIHEQLHWWVEAKPAELTEAIVELRKLLPNLPSQGAARSEYSTYLHLIVCYLESEALIHFLGKKSSDEILHEMMNVEKIYPWIYGEVLRKNLEISKIVDRKKLRPKFLQKPTKNPSFS